MMEPENYFLGYYDMIYIEGSPINDSFKISLTATYFALTTLSTIGLGDYHPIANSERILMVLIFLIGVSIFSYLLGIFIEILYSYSLLMSDVEDEDRLQGFFNTLKSYNGGKRINVKL
jgi:hypothetical protein